MKFWRSAWLISQQAAVDYDNSRWGRPLRSVEMNFETFVPAGAAVAFVGANFCHFPPGWISDVVNWDNIQRDPWGIVHEMDYHHQSNWANGVGDEMSNNVLNLMIYAKSNQASAPRTANGGLGGWPAYSTSFQQLNNNDGYGLSMYSTWLHFFGVDKMSEYIRCDQSNSLYNRNTYGRRGAQLLTTSKIFGRDMRKDFNFHWFNDSVLGSFKEDAQIWKDLAAFKLKPFHPVTNSYATGFVDDN